jgi:hypothetical protein
MLTRSSDRHVSGWPGAVLGSGRSRAVDPGWGEAWWWLGIPLAVGIALPAIFAVAPRFYINWVHPEGYGILEVSHFLMPATGFIICLGLLHRPEVGAFRLRVPALVLCALACLYIAGEEHSWGQHLFHWRTPEYWAALNRQQETNLHNVSPLFDKVPRFILETAIVLGGLGAPLWQRLAGAFRPLGLDAFLPSTNLMPTALMAVGAKLLTSYESTSLVQSLIYRPSEVAETYYYMFILFYLIVLRRRLTAG